MPLLNSENLKLDILALASHPDDTELCIGGILAKHAAMGQNVGVVDFTRGEMGTRGTAETRDLEAAEAAEILGLKIRENLGFKDALFKNDDEHRMEVIKVLRKYRPDILLINAFHDRHPDHGRAFQLSSDACFMAGLNKLETTLNGKLQEAWRPKVVYSYIQSRFIEPDIIVDVTEFWETKMKAVRAFKTQFHDPESKDPETFLSSPGFMKLIEGRAAEFGQAIGVEYGEGLNVQRWTGVKHLTDLL